MDKKTQRCVFFGLPAARDAVVQSKLAKQPDFPKP
jgi:hypothetical protein